MRNTDKTKVSYIYITDVSYNTVDTIHMIQLQLSTLEVIYIHVHYQLIYMNTYQPIQFDTTSIK